MKIKTKKDRRQRIQLRSRKRIHGTGERPRLSVFRSDKHIAAQVIDDMSGRTLAAASSSSKEIRGDLPNGGNIAAARLVGKSIAERAKTAGIAKVAFDRGGRQYHGRVKALAEAARKAGLQF